MFSQMRRFMLLSILSLTMVSCPLEPRPGSIEIFHTMPLLSAFLCALSSPDAANDYAILNIVIKVKNSDEVVLNHEFNPPLRPGQSTFICCVPEGIYDVTVSSSFDTKTSRGVHFSDTMLAGREVELTFGNRFDFCRPDDLQIFGPTENF